MTMVLENTLKGEPVHSESERYSPNSLVTTLPASARMPFLLNIYKVLMQTEVNFIA